jgi:ADP-ribose pyrophosphatase
MATRKTPLPAKTPKTTQSTATKPASVKASATKATATRPTGKPALQKTAAPLKLKGKPRVLSSKEVFRGRVFWVTSDQVAEPGGITVTREVIRHNGSVVILAIDTRTNPRDPGVLLIRQYRHAAGKLLFELPAGRIEPGEKLLPAARRELLEETGYRARRWSKLVRYYASPGFLTEAMHILLAEDLTVGQAQPEDDEKIELHMTPLSRVLAMIHDGKIEDGKTLIGVLTYASRMGKRTR